MLHNYSLFGTSDDAHCDRQVMGEETVYLSDMLLLFPYFYRTTFFFLGIMSCFLETFQEFKLLVSHMKLTVSFKPGTVPHPGSVS